MPHKSSLIQKDLTNYVNHVILVIRQWGWLGPGGSPGLQNRWRVAQSEPRWVRLPSTPVDRPLVSSMCPNRLRSYAQCHRDTRAVKAAPAFGSFKSAPPNKISGLIKVYFASKILSADFRNLEPLNCRSYSQALRWNGRATAFIPLAWPGLSNPGCKKATSTQFSPPNRWIWRSNESKIRLNDKCGRPRWNGQRS